MRASLISLIACLLVASTVKAQEKSSPDAGVFRGKVIVAQLGGRNESHAISAAGFQTIGGRTFLVGTHALDANQTAPKVNPKIAIAWERVETFMLYDDLKSFQNRYGALDPPSPELELRVSERMIQRLDADVQHGQEQLAREKVDLAKLKDKAAETKNENERGKLKEVIAQRKKEFAEMKKRVEEQLAERRKLVEQAEQLRHKILKQPAKE
jgi:hypothetical protein